MTDSNNPDALAREALRLRDERDALLDRVLYLGGIVQAACDELGIHHDTSASAVSATIRQLRERAPDVAVPAGSPLPNSHYVPAILAARARRKAAPASPVSPAPDTEETAR